MQIWMSGQRRNENVLLDKKRNLSVVHHMLKAVALVGWRRLFPLHSKWFLSFVFSCFLSFFALWESQDMTSDLLDQKLKALSAEECRSVTKYEEGWFCFLKALLFFRLNLHNNQISVIPECIGTLTNMME